MEVVEWFKDRPLYFFGAVIGVCFCCFCLTNSCARVMEAEYKYKAERDKSFWQRGRNEANDTKKDEK
jgi:hypothetical protein